MADAQKLKRALEQARQAGDAEAVALFEADLAAMQSQQAQPVQIDPMAETARAAAQGLTFGFADELEAALRTGQVSGQQYEQLRNQLRAQQEQFAKEYPLTSIGSQISGSLPIPGGILAKAKQAPSLARTVATGAGMGGVTGYGTSTGEETASDVVTGALTGAGTAGVLGGLGAMIAHKVQPAARKLQEEGVQLTPGAAFGGQVQAIEQGAESLPVVGQLVKGARQQSFESFNKAAFNRALKEIDPNLTVPKDMRLRDAAVFTYGQISSKYDEIYPNITLKYNNTLGKQFDALLKKHSPSNLGDDTFNQFKAKVDDIKSRVVNVNKNGKIIGTKEITGGQVKALKEDLRMLTDAYRTSTGSEKLLGNALDDLENSIMLNLRNQNPEYAKELKKADTAYANYKRVESAASAARGESGTFSPAQLESAVRQADKSKGKSQFARGQALMQDLSSSGYDVLGSKVPDSGTAGRLGLAGLLTGAAQYVDPSAAILTALVSGAYTKPGMSLFNQLIKRRPAAVQRAGTGLRAAAPFVQADPFLDLLMRGENE